MSRFREWARNPTHLVAGIILGFPLGILFAVWLA
jgi:hypothetical protein